MLTWSEGYYSEHYSQSALEKVGRTFGTSLKENFKLVAVHSIAIIGVQNLQFNK